MDNPHPPPVERSVMASQVVNSHDRPCQATFIKNDEPGENPYYNKRLHYSDGVAFIASAKSARCYFCAWTWRRLLQSQQQAEINRFTTLIPS
jgi:hypothetical protein